ncbi:MAG: type II toxin-antitoxin system VapC family toxin [Bacteroidota bacterium]
MNGTNLLLDTNIILYLLDGDETLVEILDEKHVYVSFITELELYGFKKLTLIEKQKIDKVLSACTVIDVNAGIKNATIEIRKNYKVKLPDGLIAGTALYFDMPLLSADKGFQNIKSLDLINYEK